MNRRNLLALVSAIALCAVTAAHAQSGATATVAIRADQPGVRISSNLFGIFFEEINCGGDGGLYAELVRNRSFEEPSNTNYWQLVTTGSGAGQVSADSSQPLGTRNTWAALLTQSSPGGTVGIANPGWWGMNLQAGQTYDLTLYARRAAGYGGPLTARLENADGSQVLAQGTITGLTTAWQKFALSLTPTVTSTNGRLVVAISQAGSVWLDVVSLFPRATFHGRTNGLRMDLAGMLDDLNPAFMRFPGGCWVEGAWMTNAYRWKATVGDPANRATITNLWQYMSNNGLGYHEYLQLCEDLGAEPLFVINCGMAHGDTIALADMGEYVQDALDALEYANGPTNSTWGAQRAANGHPAPFHLKYMEIGNENGGTAYNDRYALFYDAIKAAWPEVQLVACVWGGTPTSRPLDIIDEHYYNNPAFFIANAGKYDGYSRSGPKIYVGEYAVTSGNGNGNLLGALAEAAFMTGMERNADIVAMGSYAPLFANLNKKVWNPDLIYFDSSRVAGTPSYYVQKMFARNPGDRVLPVSLDVMLPYETNQLPRGAIGLGSWNTAVQYTNIVVASNGVTLYQSDFSSGAPGWQVFNGAWSTSGGIYQQTSATTTDCRSTTGNTNWANYTLTLRARKVSGSEGFLILFNWRNDTNWTWWNIGGWNNTKHALEYNRNGSKSTIGSQVAGSIETNRWYDIRIELNGPRVRCYLDNVLIQEAAYPASRTGAVGLGTWATAASYTNVVVTRDGTNLYQSDFSSGAPGWQVLNGSWSASGGVYQQTSTSALDCRSTTGSTNWSDYTLDLQARKDGGNEGFLIIFNWRDNNNFTWWNIGGWGNTKHAIEVCENGSKSTLGNSVNGSITNGGWYNIRVQLDGSRIRCYLNNTLVHDVSYPANPGLLASASYHEASGQVILKAVNVSGAPMSTTLNLNGLGSVAPQASLLQLSSPNATIENTLASPTNVIPVAATLSNASTNFALTLPANSLSVLRFQTPPTLPIRVGLAGSGTNFTPVYGGIALQLSSFITNTVLVGYTIESADGSVITNGTLQFVPGTLRGTISLPAGMMAPGAFYRVTLHDPVNCQLDTPSHVYFAQDPDPVAPLRLELARYNNERLLYWVVTPAQLESSPSLPGQWTTLTNALWPFPLQFDATNRFFRLRQ